MYNKQTFQYQNRRSQPQIQQAPAVSFSSGMTSQQKYQSIVDSVKISLSGRADQSVKGCQMHPKASQKCRKCQNIIQDSLKSSKQVTKESHNDLNQVSLKQQFALSEQIPEQIKLNTQNPKNHINQKLQSNIMSSNKYKTLRDLKSVKEVLSELSHDQIPIEAYLKGTTENPTEFMMTFFRIMELKPTKPQLLIMMKSNNVNVRALGLIYVRIAVDYEQIYAFLKASFDDNKLINAMMTAGELAYKLSSEQGMEQGGIRMPRIPTKIQKAMDKKVLEYRNQQNGSSENRVNTVQIEGMNLQSESRVRQERSRSREKEKKKRSVSSSSSSSSSQSSSSSSSSSSGQSQKQKAKEKLEAKDNQPKQAIQIVPKGSKTISKPNEQAKNSLQDIRSRIQQSLREKQQQQKKRKILLQKYNAQEKINQNQDDDRHSQESDSVEKYQMN